jgi:hypothetical protein
MGLQVIFPGQGHRDDRRATDQPRIPARPNRGHARRDLRRKLLRGRRFGTVEDSHAGFTQPNPGPNAGACA